MKVNLENVDSLIEWLQQNKHRVVDVETQRALISGQTRVEKSSFDQWDCATSVKLWFGLRTPSRILSEKSELQPSLAPSNQPSPTFDISATVGKRMRKKRGSLG